MVMQITNQFIDKSTGQQVQLSTCACTNNVFYVTVDNVQFCACCLMTAAEAQAAKDAADSVPKSVEV